MPTTTFVYKSRAETWIYLVAAITIWGLTLFILFEIFFLRATTNISFFYLTIIALISATSSTLLLMSSIYRIQYENVDKGKTLLLDKKNRQLQIICNQKSYTINNADIKDLGIYYSWNTKSILPGYLKINLFNGNSFIITHFLASEFDLWAVFKDKKTITKRRLMNKISKEDIKQNYLSFH